VPAGQTVEIDGRELNLTNLDKVLYPKAGFTKGQVIDYYARIAEVMVPHLEGRPVTLRRFPNGVDSQSFFEKRCPDHRPDWLGTAAMELGRKGRVEFCACNDRASLVWMAQLAALELHPSLARGEATEEPTTLAFDLDPGAPATIRECCKVGLLVRELLDGLGVECFPKTSGSKGLQVYAPLNSGLTYETTKPFAQAVAQLLEKRHPKLVVSRMTKDLRKGKVFVDWSQNTFSKTTVSVYSLRAKERPTASTPLTWEEVEKGAKGRAKLVFEASKVLKRIDEHGDLFAPVLELKQELPELG
jgi:bifunctional non-homologous end joining protein LigD